MSKVWSFGRSSECGAGLSSSSSLLYRWSGALSDSKALDERSTYKDLEGRFDVCVGIWR